MDFKAFVALKCDFFLQRKKYYHQGFYKTQRLAKKMPKKAFFYLKPLAGSRRRLYLLVHFLLDLKEL